MTDLADALLALILALAVNFAIILRIRWRLGEEGQFLARIYAWSLALRTALALFLNAQATESSFAASFWGDSTQYDLGGHLLALFWSGEAIVNPYVEQKVSGWGFYYVVAMLYYVFGRNQLLVQLFNATLGCLTIVLLYAMAKDLFDVAVARWAARFMAFFPQMVFWSGGMYKDTAIMFCIAACMYSVLQLRRAFRLRQLLLFVGAGLALMTFRFYVFYFVAFATVGTFLFSQRRGLIGGVFGQLTLLGVFLAAFSVASSSEMLDRHTSYFDLERVQIAREDQARWGASGFAAESDVSTVEGALTALPVGLVYLLFAPFPWAISGIRQALTVPETLVWYALMPSFVRGLRHTIRHRLRDALPILVFAAALTGAYALFQGNVGTAYRQRTQVTMFYFMFMAVGLTQRRRAAAPGVLPAAQPAR